MALDKAIDRFRAHPSPINEVKVRSEAAEYFNDEMIGEQEYDAIISWLNGAGPDPYEGGLP